MLPLADNDVTISTKYPEIKQIPSTHSLQSFQIKAMEIVSAVLFSIIAIALVIYFYGKRKTRTHEKGMFIGLFFVFF